MSDFANSFGSFLNLSNSLTETYTNSNYKYVSDIQGDIVYYKNRNPVYSYNIGQYSLTGLLVYCDEKDVNLEFSKNTKISETQLDKLGYNYVLAPKYYKIRFLSGLSTYHTFPIFNYNLRLFEEITGDCKYDNLSMPEEFIDFLKYSLNSNELKSGYKYAINGQELGIYKTSFTYNPDSNSNISFPVLTFIKNNQEYNFVLHYSEIATPLFYIIY